MNIVGKMHGLLCDEDGLNKVGVNTHFTAVRFKTLQVDSPEVHQEDRLTCILTRLTTCFLEQGIHFLAHWRSTYPYRFAALLDPSSRDAAFTETRVLVKALESARQMKGAFWTNVIRNSCLEWVLSKETLDLIEREGYQYTTRVQAQVTRMRNHHVSTLVTERGFKWIRDQSRSNANEQLSQLSLWETPTRRGVLDKHGYAEVKVDQLGHFSEDVIYILATSLHTPIFSKSSDTFNELPGKGRPTWRSPKAEHIPEAGGGTDMLCWAHLNAKMMDAHHAWRSMLVSASDIIFRSAVPEELYICMGTSGYVSYLWPIVTRTIGHANVFDYMTVNITHLKGML